MSIDIVLRQLVGDYSENRPLLSLSEAKKLILEELVNSFEEYYSTDLKLYTKKEVEETLRRVMS